MSFRRPPLARAYVAGSVTILLWAGSFPVITVGVRHVDPSALAATRFAMAAVAAGAWLAWRRDQLPSAKDLAHMAICSLLGIALYNILLNSGQRSVSPGAASFIVATQTVFAAGLAHLLGKQRIGPTAIGGTALSLVGVGLISLGQATNLTIGVGTPLILLAAACSGLNFVLQQPLAVKYGGAATACWTMVLGALCLAPWLPAGLEQACSATIKVRTTRRSG